MQCHRQRAVLMVGLVVIGVGCAGRSYQNAEGVIGNRLIADRSLGTIQDSGNQHSSTPILGVDGRHDPGSYTLVRSDHINSRVLMNGRAADDQTELFLGHDQSHPPLQRPVEEGQLVNKSAPLLSRMFRRIDIKRSPIRFANLGVFRGRLQPLDDVVPDQVEHIQQGRVARLDRADEGSNRGDSHKPTTPSSPLAETPSDRVMEVASTLTNRAPSRSRPRARRFSARSRHASPSMLAKRRTVPEQTVQPQNSVALAERPVPTLSDGLLLETFSSPPLGDVDSRTIQASDRPERRSGQPRPDWVRERDRMQSNREQGSVEVPRLDLELHVEGPLQVEPSRERLQPGPRLLEHAEVFDRSSR